MPDAGCMMQDARSREGGQAAVEFALLVPLLMLVLAVLVQTGLAMHAQIVVTQCAREGARQATTADSDAEIIQAVRKSAGTLDPSRLDVGWKAPRGWRAGEPVTVTVRYRLPVFVPLAKRVFPNLVALKASTTMRIEKEREK